MKRRSYSEIQTNDQVPNVSEYSEYVNKDYSKLVPTYKHSSLRFTCSSSDNTIIDSDPNIYYNNVYDYLDTSIYHRDNYCLIPLYVPSMSLQALTYGLSHDVLQDSVPKISEKLNLDYDSSFLIPDNSLMLVALNAAPDPSRAILLSILTRECQCIGYSKPNPCPDDTCSTFIQPLDSIDIMIVSISDEYAYTWPDLWDMSALTTYSRNRQRRPIDSDSSTSSSNATGPFVFLGKISGTSMGSGGTVSVSGIKVSGSGGISSGNGSAVVNVPII